MYSYSRLIVTNSVDIRIAKIKKILIVKYKIINI